MIYSLYVKTISEYPPKTLYCSIVQNHIKGSVPVSQFSEKAPSIVKDTTLNLVKGLKNLY
jgi:hypothetical protein